MVKKFTSRELKLLDQLIFDRFLDPTWFTGQGETGAGSLTREDWLRQTSQFQRLNHEALWSALSNANPDLLAQLAQDKFGAINQEVLAAFHKISLEKAQKKEEQHRAEQEKKELEKSRAEPNFRKTPGPPKLKNT